MFFGSVTRANHHVHSFRPRKDAMHTFFMLTWLCTITQRKSLYTLILTNSLSFLLFVYIIPYRKIPCTSTLKKTPCTRSICLHVFFSYSHWRRSPCTFDCKRTPMWRSALGTKPWCRYVQENMLVCIDMCEILTTGTWLHANKEAQGFMSADIHIYMYIHIHAHTYT